MKIVLNNIKLCTFVCMRYIYIYKYGKVLGRERYMNVKCDVFWLYNTGNKVNYHSIMAAFCYWWLHEKHTMKRELGYRFSICYGTEQIHEKLSPFHSFIETFNWRLHSSQHTLYVKGIRLQPKNSTMSSPLSTVIRKTVTRFKYSNKILKKSQVHPITCHEGIEGD
jgi:hypothetical protein